MILKNIELTNFRCFIELSMELHPRLNFAHKLSDYFLEPRQYYICAYCEISLNELGKHIEHIKPKSRYPEETFNYQELVLSCIDDKHLQRQEHSCGHYKLDNYDPLFICVSIRTQLSRLFLVQW
jgi:hypothetical protein